MLSGAKSVAPKLQLGKKAPRSTIYTRQRNREGLPATVAVFCFYPEAVSEAVRPRGKMVC
jgi:hypothetical protein